MYVDIYTLYIPISIGYGLGQSLIFTIYKQYIPALSLLLFFSLIQAKNTSILTSNILQYSAIPVGYLQYPIFSYTRRMPPFSNILLYQGIPTFSNTLLYPLDTSILQYLSLPVGYLHSPIFSYTSGIPTFSNITLQPWDVSNIFPIS